MILGATKVEQVKTNAGVSDLPKLGDVIHSDLETLQREEIAKKRSRCLLAACLVFTGTFRASDKIFYDLRIANPS